MGTRTTTRTSEIKLCDICGEDITGLTHLALIRHEEPDIDVHVSCYDALPEWMKQFELSYLFAALGESELDLDDLTDDSPKLGSDYWVFVNGKEDAPHIVRIGSPTQIEELADEMGPEKWLEGCYHDRKYYKLEVRTTVKLVEFP